MIGEILIAVSVGVSGWSIRRALDRLLTRIDLIERRMTYVEGNTMLAAQHLEGIAADTVYIQPIRDRVDALSSDVNR